MHNIKHALPILTSIPQKGVVLPCAGSAMAAAIRRPTVLLLVIWPLICPGLRQYGCNRFADKTAMRDPYLAARLYLQIAEAWAVAGEDTRAMTALESAYTNAPNDAEIELLAAPVFAEMGRWGRVKRALDTAEAANNPSGGLSADALVLRGRAKFNLTDHESAAKDVRAALKFITRQHCRSGLARRTGSGWLYYRNLLGPAL